MTDYCLLTIGAACFVFVNFGTQRTNFGTHSKVRYQNKDELR